MRFYQAPLALFALCMNVPVMISGFVPSSPISLSKQTRKSNFDRNHVWNKIQSGRISHSHRQGKKLGASVPISMGLKAIHSNTSYVLTFILWLSTFGISLERRTVVGKALSAPLATMALALLTANIGLLPFQSPICKMITSFFFFPTIQFTQSHETGFIAFIENRLDDKSIPSSPGSPTPSI